MKIKELEKLFFFPKGRVETNYRFNLTNLLIEVHKEKTICVSTDGRAICVRELEDCGLPVGFYLLPMAEIKKNGEASLSDVAIPAEKFCWYFETKCQKKFPKWELGIFKNPTIVGKWERLKKSSFQFPRRKDMSKELYDSLRLSLIVKDGELTPYPVWNHVPVQAGEYRFTPRFFWEALSVVEKNFSLSIEEEGHRFYAVFRGTRTTYYLLGLSSE